MPRLDRETGASTSMATTAREPFLAGAAADARVKGVRARNIHVNKFAPGRTECGPATPGPWADRGVQLFKLWDHVHKI